MTPEQQAAIREAVHDATVTVYFNGGSIIDCADAAIAAHLRALEAAGLCVVPIEPTNEMSDAAYNADLDIYWGYSADGRPGSAEDVYRLMIAARPR
jgi:hypothetical protein